MLINQKAMKTMKAMLTGQATVAKNCRCSQKPSFLYFHSLYLQKHCLLTPKIGYH